MILVALLWITNSGSALAHKPSDSYLKIDGTSEKLSVQWDIALKDLEFLIGIDANLDGKITWGEVKSSQDAIVAKALSQLTISADEKTIGLSLEDMLVTQHSDGAYAVLSLVSDCPGDVDELKVRYSLLFDVDPTHRGLVLYRGIQSESTHVLSPSEPEVQFQTSESGWLRALVGYIGVGVWHIWIGFDHILFLISLLLPAVYFRAQNQWQPVTHFRPAFVTVLKIVTSFTLAHSITLWLAVMEYVTLPSQWVEAAIAFSIIVTCANNLYPVLPSKEAVIAFGFGMIHGFGFANVLLDLGLGSVTLAISLLGFNLGVELGQLAIVIVFLPLAFLLRGTSFYRRIIFQSGSLVIALIAIVWMIERVGNYEILGF